MLRVFSLGPKAATSLPVTAIAKPNEQRARYNSILQQTKRIDHSAQHTTRQKGRTVKETFSQPRRRTQTAKPKVAVEEQREEGGGERPARTESWNTVTETLFSYPTGRPWKLPPIGKTLLTEELRLLEGTNSGVKGGQQQRNSQDLLLRSSSLRIIRTTQDHETAWEAYRTLLRTHHPKGEQTPPIPYVYLHRLNRLFSQARPKTRTNFLRHVSVLLTLHKSGGQVHLHEWNSLLHSAGRGWRKGNKEDYLNALGVFLDMVEGRPPATTFLSGQPLPDLSLISIPSTSPTPPPPPPGPQKSDSSPQPLSDQGSRNPQPDVISYTALLSAASRSNSQTCFLHAINLFQSSGLRPNRITHLCMLRYYTDIQNQSGVESVLQQMVKHDHSLGIDGLNAALWAYARCEAVTPLSLAYRVLRHSIRSNTRINPTLVQEPQEPEGWFEKHRAALEKDYSIVIEPQSIPNQATFCMASQVLAHHGDLTGALTVFTDMLLAFNKEIGAPVKYPMDGKLSAETAASLFSTYQPSMVVFRGLFLGFARHGVAGMSLGKPPAFNPFLSGLSADFFKASDPQSILYPDTKAAQWSLVNLQCLFEQFTSISWNRSGEKMTPSIWYWIMVAFGRTSNYDLAVMRETWVVLEREFGPPRTGANGRLFQLRRTLFKDEP